MPAARNAAFDAEVARGFEFYASLAPEVATFSGLTTHDARLPPATREALFARSEMLGEWSRALQSFDPKSLAPDQALDAQTLPKIHALFRFGLEDLRTWETLPDALGDVGNLYFLMTFAGYDSEERRWENMAARLEALPPWLETWRARVTRPDPRWSRVAAEVGESFPLLLEALSTQAAKVVPGALARRVAAAVKSARDAAATHTEWAKKNGAGPERWAIGKERFEELLRLKGIPFTAAEVEAIGEEQLRTLGEERARLAEQVAPGKGFDGALALLKENRPKDFPEALAAVTSLVAESRRKVVEDRIAAIPPGEVLDVIETPEFMRPLTPFAAIFPALKYAKVQRGIYVVTPPAGPRPSAEGAGAGGPHGGEAPGNSDLGDTHYADLHNVVCHEGYPGHHLQLTTANQGCSPVRSVDLSGFPFYGGCVYAIDLVEGWAHYCEPLMKEHGFHDTPADRLVLVNDALWRAARVVLDVRLHSGRLDADGAIRFLSEATGMSTPGATAEVNRYTMTPTYQLSYCIGKHLLLSLAAEHRSSLGPRWTERAFHDLVLEAGCIPVDEIRRAWRSGLLPTNFVLR